MKKNESPKTTIQQSRENQFITTVPIKYIRSGKFSKGDVLCWKKVGDNICLSKYIERDDKK